MCSYKLDMSLALRVSIVTGPSESIHYNLCNANSPGHWCKVCLADYSPSRLTEGITIIQNQGMMPDSLTRYLDNGHFILFLYIKDICSSSGSVWPLCADHSSILLINLVQQTGKNT